MRSFTTILFLMLSSAPAMGSEALNEDGQNPYISIARVHIKQGTFDEYFKVADAVDAAVQRTEPGMLFHNFDADPDDNLAFTWTEVYENSSPFLAHASNPPVLNYVKQHGQLGDGFSIEIYGNVSANVIERIHELKFPLKHFKTTQIGFVRASITD